MVFLNRSSIFKIKNIISSVLFVLLFHTWKIMPGYGVGRNEEEHLSKESFWNNRVSLLIEVLEIHATENRYRTDSSSAGEERS